MQKVFSISHYLPVWVLIEPNEKRDMGLNFAGRIVGSGSTNQQQKISN